MKASGNLKVLRSGQFLGSTVKRLETRSFRTRLSSYRANAFLERHAHREPNIFVMLEGRMCENDHLVFKRGVAGYHPANFPHTARMGASESRILNIGLKRTWFDRLAPGELQNGFARTENLLVHELARQLMAAIRAGHKSLAEQRVTRMLPLLLAGKFRETAATDRFADVVELIHEKYAQKLTVSEIAKRLALHPGHLSRQFRGRFGCSLNRYVKSVRLEHACQMLLETDQPIAAIAQHCGFSDQSHLTSSMNKTIGNTPRQYRREHSGG